MRSICVACALLPRFELVSAIDAARPGGEARRELLLRPLALAPEPGRPGLIGEASGAAEAQGVKAGMRLGEALARCPELALVPADPVRAERDWEDVARRLEGIGAAVDSERAGEAFFEAAGLRGLWGGDLEGVLARARRAIELAGPARRRPLALLRLRGRRPGGASGGRSVIVPEGAARGPSWRRSRSRCSLPGSAPELPRTLERLGIKKLGKLAALEDATVADRFGKPGLAALRLARGEDERPRPRRPREPLAASSSSFPRRPAARSSSARWSC